MSPDVIGVMTDTLTHRGPDAGNHHVRGPVALGNRRLKIQDLSEAGAQPMFSPDRQVVLVYNGEIYNFEKLRAKHLPDEHFEGHCDTELLLRLYLKLGEGCLDDLIGMFAFAIWDGRKGELFCARDRLGIKPFYWTRHEDRFLFGSEIKALLAAGVPARPDHESLRDYMVHGYYDHSSYTFFEGVRSLEPGHILKIKGGEITTRRYWSLAEGAARHVPGTREEFIEGYRDLLHDAIRLRLRSDVPIGVNVSGGLDSCLVSILLNEVAGGSTKFPLYCYGYEDERYDEYPYAKRLGDRLGWETRKVTLDWRDVPALAHEAMFFEEQPHPGIVNLAKHNAFKRIQADGVKVILSGHGGDETAGGYQYFVGAFILDFVQKYGWVRANQELSQYLERQGLSEADKGVFLLKTLNVLFHGQATSDGQNFSFLEGLSPEFLGRPREREIHFERPFAENGLNLQYQDLRYTKVPRILRIVDRASMGRGVEKRVPILDHRLVEYSFSAPIDYRMKDGHLRHFMRSLAHSILPSDLLALPKRHSSDPQRAWFQNELASWVGDHLSSASFRDRGIFRQDAVLAEFDAYRKQESPKTSYHLWQMVCLEQWWRMWIDTGGRPGRVAS